MPLTSKSEYVALTSSRYPKNDTLSNDPQENFTRGAQGAFAAMLRAVGEHQLSSFSTPF